MRILAILLALVLAQAENALLWAEFGDWAVPFTWLIWLVPCPVVLRDEPCTYKVSRFFQPIIVRVRS